MVRVFDLPCSRPPRCAFGSDGPDTLYVTFARLAMDDDHLARNPVEGGLFAMEPGPRVQVSRAPWASLALTVPRQPCTVA